MGLNGKRHFFLFPQPIVIVKIVQTIKGLFLKPQEVICLDSFTWFMRVFIDDYWCLYLFKGIRTKGAHVANWMVLITGTQKQNFKESWWIVKLFLYKQGKIQMVKIQSRQQFWPCILPICYQKTCSDKEGYGSIPRKESHSAGKL